MRVQKVILLMWMGWSLSASACSCIGAAPQYFLNTVARGPASPYMALPENAKGILFFSEARLRGVKEIDPGKSLVKSIPPAVTAAQFSIVEVETARSINPIVTRLNVDRQIGMAQSGRFYARKMGTILQDVTADIVKANGLFRVGPVGGFRSGHTYQFTYRPHDAAQQSLQTEVKIGPAITLPSSGNYDLRLAGQPMARMISLPEGGRCSERTTAIVQELNYTVPPILEAYRNGVLFFTQERTRFDEDGKEPAFTESRYESALCINTPLGHGELGALKDLAVAVCERYGRKWEDRLVKGYVGMLEIEDALHETTTYTIPLKKSAKALCAAPGTID